MICLWTIPPTYLTKSMEAVVQNIPKDHPAITSDDQCTESTTLDRPMTIIETTHKTINSSLLIQEWIFGTNK